ncbi:MAG: RNA-specific pseudouridylate synthase [Planctomycetota bacterium]|nr:RNA-specific pseudouridylate synthase [Planctomycetota bacterium]
MPLDLLHEDAHVLVVNKPSGVLTQGRRPGESSLESSVRSHLNPENPTSAYVGTVHRLDRPVSGVIVWAKNSRAARRLASQFASREVKKEYWAAITSEQSLDRGLWEDWLIEEDTGLGLVQICLPGTPRSRRAVTRYQVQKANRLPFSTILLALFPETGRTHQLRVQTASRGHAILGDTAYGSRQPFPEGIALHARALTIRHPITDEWLRFEAPLPRSWELAGIVPAIGRGTGII